VGIRGLAVAVPSCASPSPAPFLSSLLSPWCSSEGHGAANLWGCELTCVRCAAWGMVQQFPFPPPALLLPAFPFRSVITPLASSPLQRLPFLPATPSFHPLRALRRWAGSCVLGLLLSRLLLCLW
jgi:hypothetical protein